MFHSVVEWRIKNTEVNLARRNTFKSDKRRKELNRAKKQEEKRQQRFGKGKNPQETPGEETTAKEESDEGCAGSSAGSSQCPDN